MPFSHAVWWKLLKEMTALAVTTRMQSIPVESRQTSTFNIFINLIPHKQKKQSNSGVNRMFEFCLANQRQSDSETDPWGDGRFGRSRDLTQYTSRDADSVSEETGGERKSFTERSGTMLVIWISWPFIPTVNDLSFHHQLASDINLLFELFCSPVFFTIFRLRWRRN